MKKVKTKASARNAAELLASQSSSAGGFGSGFGAGFGGAFGAAFAQPADSADSGDEPNAWAQLMASRSRDQAEVTDPALVLAFKQLSKRDPVTRLKALESISALFAGMDAATATGVLQPWLQVYEKIQLDNDRRVREHLYKTFAVLLARVPGKSLQPHLRAIFPLWWLHQQDPSAEVARESSALFTATFPTAAKRAQVLLYCHREYFSYCASLFTHTPQTLSDQTLYSLEESVEKWERIIACALMSVAEFINITATAEAAPAAAPASASAAAPTAAAPSVAAISAAAYSTLLTPALWKLASCRTVHIRRAFYALLKSLVVHDPAGAVEANLPTLAPLTLTTLLDETDRTNQQSMLDTMLTFLRKFGTQAWEQLSKPTASGGGTNMIQSAFYPRLQKMMMTGLGNWNTVYPMLLPLLSLLPDSVMLLAPAPAASAAAASTSSAAPPSLVAFYSFFFNTLWEGRRVLRDAATGAGSNVFLTGSREFHALLDCYNECLLFSIKKRKSDAALVRSLVHNHLLASPLALALHFASASASDPSLTKEAHALNKFGVGFFERAGRTIAQTQTILQPGEVQEMWAELTRTFSAALQAAGSAPPEAAEAAVVEPVVGSVLPSPPKRANAAAAAVVASVDSYAAVGIILSQVRSKAASAGDDNQSARTPLLQCVSAVFQLSLAHFTERPAADRFSSLKLSAQLAETYSLTSILAATDASPSLSSFLSSSLLPVLRQLLSAAGQATDDASDVATATQFNSYISTVELFCRGLLGKALEELGLDKAAAPDVAAASSSSSSSSTSSAPTRVWEELLQLLSASASLSRSTSILSAKCHLSLLRILFSLFARCRSVYGHAALQDLVVDQAERFLTCEKSELFSEYLGIFRCIISAPGLLANEVLSTLLSSFLDGVASFQKQEGAFALLACSPAQSSTSAQFVQSFEKETGCSIQALPSLVDLLGGLLVPESPLEQVSASADEAANMRAQIVHALFWLQFSARQRVATAATAAWRSMDRAALKEHPRILLDLAASFRQCLLSSPLSLFTSHFIESWSAWLVLLYSTVSHPFLQQKILDSALPTHAELKQLMAGEGAEATSLHDVAERLRVIRDLLSELLSSAHSEALNERVLFLGEASPSQVGAAAPAASNSSSLQWEGTPRLTLLLDLLAVHSFLRCFEREADPVDMPPNDQVSLAISAEQALADEDHSHQSIRARLQRYVASGFLSSSQLLALLKSALAESKSAVKDSATASPEVVTQATNSARAYTAALTWLLRFVHDAYFAADSSNSAAIDVQKMLVAFLASVPQNALRTQDHTALFPPLEATLVAVVESGCLRSDAAVPVVVQMSKLVLAGLEAGMRLLAQQNSKLFALASSLRLSAVLLRALSACSRAGGANEELQSTLVSSRAKLLALAANLNLFEALPTGAAGFSLEAARFLDARSSLLLALVESSSAGAGDDVTLDTELPQALLQSMVLWSGSVVRFATNQHAAAIAQSKRPAPAVTASSSSSSFSSSSPVASVDVSAAWNLQYLSSTFALMAYLTPRLLSLTAPAAISSNAPLSSALHMFVGTCFPLLVGRGPGSLLRVVSVKSFTRFSVDLELILRSYREARTDKMLEIVRECIRLQQRADGEVDADSADLRSLFTLLSHPFPCIALSSLHFLSIGLLERAIATPISFEIDEAAEMRHVLEASAKQSAKSNKKRQQALENGQTPESEDLELEHFRKTLRSSYRSAMTLKRQDLLMPRTLQRILEQRLQINEIDVIEEEEDNQDDDEELFFSFRPVAQQLRGHLLTWSLVLDLLSQSLPVPAAAAASSSSSSSAAAPSLSLSSERSALLVSFLRDGDCMAPFTAELVEHVLVSMTDAQVEQLILGTVARYEHRVAAEGGAAILKPAVEEAQSAPAAVIVEDEDEEGNVKPVAAAPSASPSASPAPAVDSAIREYPLWLSPCMLLPAEARADVTVRPFIMKRLLKIRKMEQGESGSDAAAMATDPCIFFGSAAALLYLRTLRVLPALSRSWFSHIDRANGAVISKLTASSFSPLLIQDELLNLQQKQAAVIAANPPADEDEEPEFAITTNYEPTIWRASGRTTAPPAVVGARFTRGEIVMGLSLKLPPCYPLLPVNVSLAESVKLKSESSRKWCLSISSILASSDGRLFDAICVWRSNLESHFSGVEECSICMAIVSATNHALPRMKCHECKNRFHSQCLYKWFQTSGNSKCQEKRTERRAAGRRP